MRSGDWQGRRVFLTGHTGFMGGWLTTYLMIRGAEVHGFALTPPTDPSFFDVTGLGARMASSTIGDVRDLDSLTRAMRAAAPEVICHLAAQPLVLPAFEDPKTTFEINVMGTLNLMQAAREQEGLAAMLLVTTDKVYFNQNWHWPYRENEPLGGREPYSASKVASEMVISAYANSYLDGVGIAALRVGNIIGGGDWARHRLIPDAVRCFSNGAPLVLRHPHATRPWQHVLDPLPGYLALAEALLHDPSGFSGGWNLGPIQRDCQPVDRVAYLMTEAWGGSACVAETGASDIYEETFLSLDSSKATQRLGWAPRWNLETAIARSVEWYQAAAAGQDMAALTQAQIDAFDKAG
ncbi:CDP-glucose 4,6-dehydratase [Loktanella sp. DJP18]|uniref:CDP-glucose 4,6-dehydratase n=1 Tax=Loktanella sp. DJP18 TaxID=3409788 RepID=UPI003BB7CFBF